ncbi:MAG: peptidylprolyl isomerase [Planctomycetota bacterium]|nr:peptidylprolyl isomerase [Planctomycetota bacterium]
MPYRRCSHILFMYKTDADSPATRTKDEARKLIGEALEKVKGGADFEKLAKEVSECPSRVVGGDLEWNGLEGSLVKAFADALYKIEKVGDLSPVVETDYGFHIIKLTGLRTDADFRAGVRIRLVQDKVDAFLQQLREENVEKLRWNEKIVGRIPGAAPAEPAVKSEAPPEAPKTEEAKTAPAPAPAPDAKTE